MSIRYEGRYPDIDPSLANKRWADDTIAANAVTTSYVNGEIARVVSANNLQTTTYVDTQDGLLAKIADVVAADANHLDATARNTTVAALDGTGRVPTAQLPTNLVTERPLTAVVGSAVFTGTLTATSSSVRERRLATVNIPNPGFPYLPLPFGTVTGQAGSTSTVYPWTGNGVVGRLIVCPPAGSGDTIFGIGAGTDSPTAHAMPVVPYAASGATPANRPAVNGALTLDLYGSCFQGSGYTFSATGLVFYVLVVPA